MRIRKAFTLIELLVVIAIIALLLSIVVPSLYKGREIARMAVCSTNEKSLVMAANLWSGENQNFSIAAKWWRDPMYQHDDGHYEDNSACSLMPYLAASIKQKKDSLVCPSAKNIKFYAMSDDYRTAGHEETFTYAANGYMIFDYGVSPGEIYKDEQRTYWDKHGSTKIPTIRNPARTAYFIDHEYYFVARWFFDPTKKPEDIQSNPKFWFQTRWHQKRTADIYGIGMIGWVDGHVSREPKDFAEVVEGSQSGRRWTVYYYGK
ncbi:MAG TPA: type II secretion system protein [Anaerohalosphaeraceae bacterium]|nr:type II secretion system protein [Anaerohalosphaeraceae bacterium]HOL89715.1 type II secretion system protein [Anaerohalosphaeraceae bacterium]HPP56745.1 type II secretion system protein [Anaerohalosphaeraceae bacterium]